MYILSKFYIEGAEVFISSFDLKKRNFFFSCCYVILMKASVK